MTTTTQTPETMGAELVTLRVNMQRLLKKCGEAGTCRNCKLDVRWMRHAASGNRVPYDPDGTPHIATCGQSSAVTSQARQRTLY